jgi:hypothetical protein
VPVGEYLAREVRHGDALPAQGLLQVQHEEVEPLAVGDRCSRAEGGGDLPEPGLGYLLDTRDAA